MFKNINKKSFTQINIKSVYTIGKSHILYLKKKCLFALIRCILVVRNLFEQTNNEIISCLKVCYNLYNYTV